MALLFGDPRLEAWYILGIIFRRATKAIVPRSIDLRCNAVAALPSSRQIKTARIVGRWAMPWGTHRWPNGPRKPSMGLMARRSHRWANGPAEAMSGAQKARTSIGVGSQQFHCVLKIERLCGQCYNTG